MPCPVTPSEKLAGPRPTSLNRYRTASLVFAVLAFGLAFIAMIGWFLNQPYLRSLFVRGGSEMKFNAAVTLMLLSLSLFFRIWKPRPKTLWLGNVAAALSAFHALLVLFQYWTGRNFGIDELFFKDVPNALGTSFPGRLSVFTAWCLLFGAAGLLLFSKETRHGQRPSQWLGMAMAFFPIYILLAYAYGNMKVLAFGGGSKSYMAVPTAVALLSIALGILFYFSDRGVMRHLTAQTNASRVFRRVVLALLVLPPLLGWVVLVFFKGSEHPPEFGVSTTVMLSLAILVIITWIGTARLNRAETSIRQNEAIKSAVLESALDCIISMDHQGRITEFNPAAERTFGWRREQVLGKTVSETIMPTEYRYAHDLGLANFLKTGQGPVLGKRVEMIGLRADRSRFPIELAIAVSRLEDNLPFFTAYLRDLTETKKAEAQLRESEDRFRTMADNIAPLAWMADPQGSVFWYNKRWFDYTGLTLEQMKAQGARERVHHPDYLQRVLEKWKSHIAAGSPWEDTFPLRRQDGEYRWFLSRASPIKGPDGKVMRWFGTNSDISDLMQAQQDLRQARDQLEQTVEQRTFELRETVGELEAYSYSVTHDMRAPLRAMTGYARAMMEDFGPKLDPQAHDYLGKIISAAVRMDQLISDVLAYSKVSRSVNPLEPIDVKALVTEIISHHPSLQPPAVEIVLKDPLPLVLGEQASLSQCFTNLLLNAVKFVAPNVKPKIEISCEEVEGGVRLNVQDNGIGIAPKDLHRIFRIFERIHPQDAYEGTGIGLAIVKKAVERMGGQTGVESNPGKGSRFWLQLKKA